jgi:hypothetical protein
MLYYLLSLKVGGSPPPQVAIFTAAMRHAELFMALFKVEEREEEEEQRLFHHFVCHSQKVIRGLGK